MPRSSPFEIELSPEEKAELGTMSRSYTSPYYSVVRAKIVLLAARGLENDEIARKLDVPRQIVSKWRKRFFEEHLTGLDDRPRPGRPPTFSPSHQGGSESVGVRTS